MGNEQRPPDSNRRVRDLFARACRLPPDERAAFLDDTCADEPELRTAVESLLAHDREASEIFGHLSGGEGAALGTVAPGARLGDFELLRELGRGGMGIVYEARQVSLNRHVALKVLPPGLGLSEQAVQRFGREAKAAAKLHHTNIVSVHAIGEEEGCHYYAMELIEGQSLSQVLRDLGDRGSHPLLESAVTRTAPTQAPGKSDPHSSPTSSSPTSLSDTASGRKWFDAVATLIAEVADALEYAHGRGVIHRDIKPANLMLSGDGRLCVADFGLARVAQEPGMTVSGSLLGTPAYMSPEQIAVGRVKLDHRTDIYSLGAVLYEMLTQQRPFPGESREEVLSAILAKDPRPPRRVNPRIPVDLETICQKAMEKDPDQRYRSAGELADDLRQYLQRGLITARRASLPQRVWKATRRHPVAATAVVAVIVAGLLVGWNWRTLVSLERTDIQRMVSDARYHLMRGEIGVALEETDAILARDQGNQEGLLIRSRVHLHRERWWDSVRDARAVLQLDPENWEAHLLVAAAASKGELHSIPVDDHLAVIADRIPETADAYCLRGILAVAAWDRTRDTMQQGIAWLDKALEMDPGHALALAARCDAYTLLKDYPRAMEDAERLIVALPRSALGYVKKSWVSYQLFDYEEALAFANKAIERDPTSGDGYFARAQPIWFKGMRDESIDDVTRAIELNPTERAYTDRSECHARMGDCDRAIADADRCLEIDPDEAVCYELKYWCYWTTDRKDEAVAVLRELDQRAELWVGNTGKAMRQGIWVDYYRRNGEFERALEEANRAVELVPRRVSVLHERIRVRQLLGDEDGLIGDCDLMVAMKTDLPEELRLRASTLHNVCDRDDDALQAHQETIDAAPNWASAYLSRGDLYRMARRYDEALADFDRAVELAPAYMNGRFNRGYAYFWMGKFEEALADFDRVRAQGAKGANLTWFRAQALQRLGRVGEALAAFAEPTGSDREEALNQVNQAIMLFGLGRRGEAMDSLGRAFELNPQVARAHVWRSAASMFDPDKCDKAMDDLGRAEELEPQSATVWADVSRCYSALVYHLCPAYHEPVHALELARKAVEYDDDNASFRESLGLALYRSGAYEEAREALLESLELHYHVEAAPLFFTAMACRRLGLGTEAAAYFDRAVSRMEETWPRSPELLLIRREAAQVLGIQP